MLHKAALIVGRLQDHGRAPYPFGSGEGLSYYLKVLTDRGERVLWGTDLERAIAESATGVKRGDLIGARRIGHETVTMPPREHRGGEARIGSARLAQRNRWRVEKIQFFAERAKLARRVRDAHTDAREAVRNRPELLSTFLTLRGAREIAERRIADPHDRERFVALVREAIAESSQKGAPIPAVQLRTLPRATPVSPAPLPVRYRNERTRS